MDFRRTNRRLEARFTFDTGQRKAASLYHEGQMIHHFTFVTHTDGRRGHRHHSGLKAWKNDQGPYRAEEFSSCAIFVQTLGIIAIYVITDEGFNKGASKAATARRRPIFS